MEKLDILKRVQALVAETLDLDPLTIRPETLIKEELGADSMHVVTLVVALDDAFDLEFSLEDIPREGVTVAWVADHVQRALAGGS